MRVELALCDKLETRARSREATASCHPVPEGSPRPGGHRQTITGPVRKQRGAAPPGRPGGGTYVMLFWCSVSRAVLRSSVVARLSMLRKRSMADMLHWMLCLGMSSLETKVKQPRSS